jgi:uncharacterized protein (DUF2336 family)
VGREFGVGITMATLQDLESLARERSSDKRRALLRAISDCFFASVEPSTTEVALYDDVVTMVLDEVEPVARAELAERMADIANPPRRVLLQLAQDQIAVAQPILSRSPALDDAELERIALNQSQAHLAAIATRPTLSERVTDVLVARGDEQVVDTVVGNQGARFSPQGFTTLARLASTNESLLNRLGTRADLPAEITARLLPMISGALEARLQAAGAQTDISTLNGLAEESRSVLADRLRAATKSARPLAVIIDHVEREIMTLDDAVVELSDVDATPDVAKLIADRVDLRSDTVTRALCAPADEPVALLCRVAGLRTNGYSAIVRMRRRRRRGSDGSPAKVLEQYQNISLETAQRVLRFLKVRETAEAS